MVYVYSGKWYVMCTRYVVFVFIVENDMLRGRDMLFSWITVFVFNVWDFGFFLFKKEIY